jgi:flagella synthesis protein FlgN
VNKVVELARLKTLIEEEVVQLRRFVALLVEEERLLVEGQTDALAAVAEQKNQRYRKLQFCHQERSLALRHLGLEVTDAAIRSTLASAPDVLEKWDEILRLAQDAHRRNTLNGQLITERMKHNQTALAVLLAATEQPNFYGPDGQFKASGGGRNLGSV